MALKYILTLKKKKIYKTMENLNIALLYFWNPTVLVLTTLHCSTKQMWFKGIVHSKNENSVSIYPHVVLLLSVALKRRC